MNICKECGEPYYGRECITCKTNKAIAQHQTPKEYKKPKLNKFKKLLMKILLIGMIGISSYMTYKIIKLEEKNTQLIDLTLNQQKMIKSLTEENNKLSNQKNIKPKKITYRNKVVPTKPTNKKVATIKPTENKHYVEKNVQPKLDYSKFIKPEPRKEPTKQNYKRYPIYTNEIELVSDSKISRLHDNRLTSNAPIIGRYYQRRVGHIKCDEKRNLYKVVDECSMLLGVTLSNKVYLSKSEINIIDKFNTRTHMIECKYSKKHGVFHDCRVKLYRQ